ncbi:hypothetical protein V5F38_15570 [Xanthobacter sp. V0B-10]|uniref:hypothetical protein n=1 Tax=Xanthobacter albus TaxID=3119929 RepID=UPI0037290B40
MLSRRGIFSFLIGAGAAAVAAAVPAEAQQWRPPNQRSMGPPVNQPPAPRSQSRPPPRRGYTWVPGYWSWSSRRRTYVWNDGSWMRDRPGYRYVGPQWVLRRGEWVFIPGRWVR